MLNERKLTKSELDRREDIIQDMKKNKRGLVKRYGKDAEKVMYGRATNLAKKKTEAMDQDRLKEMVKTALMGPMKEDQVEEGNAFIVAADAARDAGKKEFEFPEGSGKIHPVKIKNDINEWGSSDQFALHQSMHRTLGEPTEFPGLSKIMLAAEDATEFYMDDFPEYETDREDLILNNARSYARKMFPDFMANAARFMEPLDEEKSVVTESKEAGLDELRSIIDQASVLGEEARNIIAAYFPSYLAQGEAYGVFNFVESSNPYDNTLVAMVEDIEGDEDSYEGDDEDLEEGLKDKLKGAFVGVLGTLGIQKYGMDVLNTIMNALPPEKAQEFSDYIEGTLHLINQSPLEEDLDLGHQDNEPHMLKADLYRIGKYAMELYQMVDGFEGEGEVDFPHWWQSKIVKSKDALVGAKHYLDFEVNEPQIDAMVDVAQDVEAIDEFDDKSMKAYGDAVKKAYGVAEKLAKQLKSK